MNSPVAKKIKLDPRQSLLRPFKSPLKSSSTPRAGKASPNRSARSTGTPDLASKADLNDAENAAAVPPSLDTEQECSFETERLASQQISELRRKCATLQSALIAAKTDLDTHQEALRIERSSRAGELHTLVQRWRSASRSAAEELYLSARERINRQGGFEAWKADKRRREAQLRSWNAENEAGPSGLGDLDQGSADTVLAADAVGGDAISDHYNKGPQSEPDEEFTMATMLDTLNVNHDLVGYSRELGDWAESYEDDEASRGH